MRERNLAWNPAVAIWEVTRACDLCCIHCRASATPGRDPRELTTVEALDLVVQLRELAPRVVVLTGDPFKRPDLDRMIGEAVGLSLFRALRDESCLGGKCGACPFRSLCGGSRARAYATTGDFLAEDPACAYQPSAWPARTTGEIRAAAIPASATSPGWSAGSR